MDPLRVIIVDDESLARRGLRLRLESIEHIEILAECGNGLEAINKIAELEPVEVIHDPRSEREIDAVRCVDEEVGSQSREGGISKGDDDK